MILRYFPSLETWERVIFISGCFLLVGENLRIKSVSGVFCLFLLQGCLLYLNPLFTRSSSLLDLDPIECGEYTRHHGTDKKSKAEHKRQNQNEKKRHEKACKKVGESGI